MLWDKRPGRAWDRLRDLPRHVRHCAFAVAWTVMQAPTRSGDPNEGPILDDSGRFWRRIVLPSQRYTEEEDTREAAWNYVIVYRRATNSEHAQGDCSDHRWAKTFVVLDIWHVDEMTLPLQGGWSVAD